MIRSLARSLCRPFLCVPGWLRLFGGACAGLGMIAILSLAGGVPGMTLQNRIRNAKVLREFHTEGARIWRVVAVNDLVGFVLHKSDSSLALVYELDGSQRFRFGIPLDSTEHQIQGLQISEDGSTVVTTEVIEIEYYRHRVFDINGRERFAVESKSWLVASPRGQQFCTETDSDEPLSDFDGTGKKSWVRPARGGNRGWVCAFLDDDRLLLAYSDTVFVVEARTGATLQSFPLPAGEVLPYPPTLSVSRADSIAVVHGGGNELMALSFDGRVLWRKTLTTSFCTAATDNATGTIVVEFGDANTRPYFEAYSLGTGKAVGRPILTPAAPPGRPRPLDVVHFHDGILSASGPAGGFCPYDDRESCWTAFAAFDAATQQWGEPFVLPGTYLTIASRDRRPHQLYLRAFERTATLVQTAEEEGK